MAGMIGEPLVTASAVAGCFTAHPNAESTENNN